MARRIFARFVVFMVTFVVLYALAAALGLLSE
jgi:hypothetical protein